MATYDNATFATSCAYSDEACVSECSWHTEACSRTWADRWRTGLVKSVISSSTTEIRANIRQHMHSMDAIRKSEVTNPGALLALDIDDLYSIDA